MNELLVEFLQNILERKRSAASLEAEKLGLEKKPGVGLYGPKNTDVVTHRSDHGKKLVAIGTSSDKNLPTPNQQIGSTDNDAQSVGITPDSLRAAARTDASSRAVLGTLRNRSKMLSNVIANAKSSTKQIFKKYKKLVDDLTAALESSPVDVEVVRKILDGVGIRSYKDLLSKSIFGSQDDAGSRLKLGIARRLQAHLPDLFHDRVKPATTGDATVKNRIFTSALFSDATPVFPVVSETQVTIGSTSHRIPRITINDKVEEQIEQYLDSQNLTPEERQARRLQIIARIDLINRSADFIAKHGKDGFIELPSGSEGADSLQGKLRDALFANQDDKEKFDTLVSAFRDAERENVSTAWKELHKFLIDKFGDSASGTIPLICEHLEAIRLMTDEPDATVYMPVSSTHPIADIIVFRKNPEGKSGFDLIDTEYVPDLNSVKRGKTQGKSGAPSKFSVQMELTVMSDDPVLGGDGTSRTVLGRMIDGIDPSEEELKRLGISTEQAAADFAQQSAEYIVRIAHLTDTATDCLCPETGKDCPDATAIAKQFFIQEVLFQRIYAKFVFAQAYSNTTFHGKGINRSDGVRKKARIKPDYRAKCEDGKLKHTVQDGRATIISL